MTTKKIGEEGVYVSDGEITTLGPEAEEGPHQGQPVRIVMGPVSEAEVAMIMIHGRGSTAESILTMARHVRDVSDDLCFLAPQAEGKTWYPHSFLVPTEQNQPHLSSALKAISHLVDQVEDAGIPPQRCVLFGFSQGACLAAEVAASNPRRYGGVIILSGGLIGPQGTKFDYQGSLDGTPVFIGCSDKDPHIPVSRVQETARVFHRLGGKVSGRIYKGMGHTINEDELNFVEDLLKSLTSQS